MDLSHPHSAVAPSLDSEVLLVLAGTSQPMTVRRISLLVNRGSYNGVKKALSRLVEQGLVLRETVARTHVHSLNREHIAAPAVDVLAALRSEFLGRLRAALGAWDPAPVHASLFGSAARGDGGTSSDIDLLVIRPDDVDEEDSRWREQFSILGERVFAWTGNRAGPIEVSNADASKLLRENPPVMRDLREDGIHLAGIGLSRLLKEET